MHAPTKETAPVVAAPTRAFNLRTGHASKSWGEMTYREGDKPFHQPERRRLTNTS